MKQFTGKLIYEFRWWRDDKKSIRPEHVEALEEAAVSRMRKMTDQGYLAGELNESVHVDDMDSPDGIDYTGWWTFTNVESGERPPLT